MYYFDFIKRIKSIKFQDKDSTNAVIATFILENLDNLDNLTSSVVAAKCFTSSSSVIRFCQKLNLNGWNELKYKLMLTNKGFKSEGRQVHLSPQLDNNYANNFFVEYLRLRDQANEELYNNFIKKNLDACVDKIIKAKRIFIFGFGVSYHPSILFAQRLIWLEKNNVICENDINVIQSYLPIINDDDVVILITLSGKNKFISEIVQEIQNQGYKIGILGEKSNLIQNFDENFIINSEEEQLWNIHSVRSQLLIQLLDFLYLKMIEKNN